MVDRKIAKWIGQTIGKILVVDNQPTTFVWIRANHRYKPIENVLNNIGINSA